LIHCRIYSTSPQLFQDDPYPPKTIKGEEDDNNLTGVITATDFATWMELSWLCICKDYMSQSFLTISIKEKVSTAAQKKSFSA
jgi:hypothetical protein